MNLKLIIIIFPYNFQQKYFDNIIAHAKLKKRLEENIKEEGKKNKKKNEKNSKNKFEEDINSLKSFESISHINKENNSSIESISYDFADSLENISEQVEPNEMKETYKMIERSK